MALLQAYSFQQILLLKTSNDIPIRGGGPFFVKPQFSIL